MTTSQSKLQIISPRHTSGSNRIVYCTARLTRMHNDFLLTNYLSHYLRSPWNEDNKSSYYHTVCVYTCNKAQTSCLNCAFGCTVRDGDLHSIPLVRDAHTHTHTSTIFHVTVECWNASCVFYCGIIAASRKQRHPRGAELVWYEWVRLTSRTTEKKAKQLLCQTLLLVRWYYYNCIYITSCPCLNQVKHECY